MSASRVICFILVCVLGCAGTSAQPQYQPSKENLAARQWFQDAKFGLFVHWGVYSVLADGEWVMNNKKIPITEYEKLPARFNPTEFNPAEWVALVKAAGMKYITITSKHHDGFAMWDSKVSDWNIVKRTPYQKDVLKLLADECQKQGVKLFFYHSQLDWHHPDYFPRGRTGVGYTGRPESGDWNKYLDFMDAQLKELLTGYGPIAGIWFDGMWDKPQADWRLARTYKLIHDLQPAALVGSNHHQAPIPGEDFQMFEKDLPGANTAGFNTTEIGTLPLETCETINGAWGYNANDKRFKSTKALIDYLARAAGYGANFLLNVGPMPNGKIQPEFVERLQQMGGWLSKYGESIYGTRGGPVPPRPWGATTRKGNTVYVHVLNWPDQVLALPAMPSKVRTAKFLKDGSPAQFAENEFGLLLKIPAGARDEYDTVVALELASN
jgi:alpha-L-fucosidase